MTPPKEGVFTNIGKNFAETLQIKDLAVKNVFLFYYVHIFVKKNSEFVLKTFYDCNFFFFNILWKKVYRL
jgi:hypothetical protein